MDMVQIDNFKRWLKDNTKYSNAVISDIVSRIKRADSILEWNDTDTYLFYLEQKQEFKILSVSVRSQLRKAVKLYATYAKVISKTAEGRIGSKTV